MSITYIHLFLNPINKTIHHTVSITFMEAELFTIRCDINQTIQIPEVSHIAIITDTIYAAYQIFNSSIHPYQYQSIAILKDLRGFFNKHSSNSIEFWDCPSNNNQPLYSIVNKKTKKFNFTPLFSCKLSWDFNKKSECDDILKTWKITFQVFNNKDR